MMPPVPPALPEPPKWVFTVRYTDRRCKDDAIRALKAIQGLKAYHDTAQGHSAEGLWRDVSVSVTGGAYRDIPGKILALFGSVQKKFVAFKVTFRDPTQQNNARGVVKALKGVRDVVFEGNGIARVFGDTKSEIVVNPRIVLNIFQLYGTARFH